MAWKKEHWPIGLRVVFIFEKTLYLIFRFSKICDFTCDFNFALENEAENVIDDNDDDDTFIDNELVNREIVNSVKNRSNGIDNVNSLNIVNDYYVHNFYDSFQIDAGNNNTDHGTCRKMDGYKSSSNGESLYLFLSLQ